MAKTAAAKSSLAANMSPRQSTVRPSSLLDTRVIYCGDNLEQLALTVQEILDEHIAKKLA